MQEEDEENILFNQADFDNFEDDAADDDKASLLNNQVNKSIQDLAYAKIPLYESIFETNVNVFRK